jgi:hypothetical protein
VPRRQVRADEPQNGHSLLIDPTRSAVLSMDLQAGVVSLYVKDETFIPRVSRVLEQARGASSRIAALISTWRSTSV